MTRLVSPAFLSLAVIASCLLPSAIAGPACAKKHFQAADCIQKCQSRWGWTGSMMGTDKWGTVMQKAGATETDWNETIAKACGTAVASSSAVSSSAEASATAPIKNVAPGPPTISVTSTSASIASSSTVIISSSTPSSTIRSTSTEASSSSVKSTSSSSVVHTSSAPTVPSSTVVSSSKHVSSTAPVNQAVAQPASSSAPPPAPTTTSKAPAPVTTTSTPLPKTTTEPPKTTTSTPAPAPKTAAASSDSENSSSDSDATSSSDISAYLSAHNTIRAQHGASPLTWSDSLASTAQTWANNCVFKHSGGTLGPFGENLAAGTGSSYGIAEAIKSWTDEVSEYDANNPVPSHFTQVVWKASTQVGCAVQSCSGIFDASFGLAKFFVCEYSPQGNVIGEFAQNVQV